MAINVKCLVEAKYAENAQTDQYAPTDGTTAVIDKATVTNASGSPATLSVNLIPSGGSAGASNLIVDAKSIPVDGCYALPELVGQVLASGDVISTLASAATSLVIRISGREIT